MAKIFALKWPALFTCCIMFITVVFVDFDVTKMFTRPGATEEGYWEEYYQNLARKFGINRYQYDFNQACEQYFSPSMAENIKLLSNYSIIREIGKTFPEIFNKFEEPVISGDEQFPVLLTGASSNHFGELKRMIKSAQAKVLPNYNGMKLVVFDLGLKVEQIETLRGFCNCEIRKFPFERYPKFVSNLLNFVWKPLIIYNMLLEENFVIWADSSTIFEGTKNATDIFFERAKDVGMLLQFLPRRFRSFIYTKAETFRILNESVCQFQFEQPEAGFVIMKKTNFTWKYVMKPWLACGLKENCMSHPNPYEVLICGKSNLFHKCHRFDQSVLSIIVQRLFNINMGVVSLNSLPRVFRFRRGV